MILRKPYAFLIKHFKFIHFIIFLLLSYILYKSVNLLTFLIEASRGLEILIGKDLTEVYIPALTLVIPLLVIILIVILVWVLIVKQKKFLDYIFVILTLIFTYSVILVANNTLTQMEVTILESRVIRLMRDFVTISIILQLYPLMLMLIRTTGFDLKRFDFGVDLQQLDISETDREEIEVNLNLDSNLYKRRYNYFFRNAKYYYKENSLIINIIAVILILSSIIIPVTLVTRNRKNINLNQTFTLSGINIKVSNPYAVSEDYRGNKISEYNSLIILPVSLRSVSGTITSINTTKFELVIKDHTFVPTNKYTSQLIDIGNIYYSQKITDKFKDYILVYEVPNTYIEEKLELRAIYNISQDGTYKYYTLKMNADNIEDNYITNDYNIGDEIIFKDILYENTKLKFEKLDIAPKFLIQYNFCLEECTLSDEYIHVKYKGSYDRTIMKLKYNFESVDTINTLEKMFKYFGSIEYIKNNLPYETSKIEIIAPKKSKDKDNLYLEVPKDIEEASSITLKFKVRDTIYNYKLR